MGIKMARQSIEDLGVKVKAHLAAKKKSQIILERLDEKINQLTDELEEEGVNIEEAVLKYIEE